MRNSLDFSIAGIGGSIVTSDPALLRSLAPLFSTFKPQGKPLFSVRIRGSFSDLKPSCGTAHPPVIISPGTGSLILGEALGTKHPGTGIPVPGESPGSEHPGSGSPIPGNAMGSIDPDTGLCDLAHLSGLDFSRLTSLLLACFVFFLGRNHGFLLHASAGTVRGSTFVFTGKSGAGKTTALANTGPDRILCQDAAAVRILKDRARIFSTPFRREPNGTAPARALFFPRKAGTPVRTLKTKPARSVARVAANTLFLSPGIPEHTAGILDSIIRFCALVPAYDLLFPGNADLRRLEEMIR